MERKIDRQRSEGERRYNLTIIDARLLVLKVYDGWEALNPELLLEGQVVCLDKLDPHGVYDMYIEVK